MVNIDAKVQSVIIVYLKTFQYNPLLKITLNLLESRYLPIHFDFL